MSALAQSNPQAARIDNQTVKSLRAILGEYSSNYGGTSRQQYLADTAVGITTPQATLSLQHTIPPLAGGFLIKITNTELPSSAPQGSTPSLSGIVIAKDGTIKELWLRDGDRERFSVTGGLGPIDPSGTLLPIAHQHIKDITAAPFSSIHRNSPTPQAAHAALWFLESPVAEEIRQSGCLLKVSTDHFIDRGLFSREVHEVVDTTWVSVTAPGRFPWTQHTLAVLEIKTVHTPETDAPFELLAVTRFGVNFSGRGLCKVFEDNVPDRTEALAELGQVPHQMSLLRPR